MNNSQIKNIIEAGENQEVEFKQSFHSSQDISKIICAFANTLGGILIIGVDDKKNIVGIEKDSDKIQQQIVASNQTVNPQPLISVELKKLGKNKIILVIVQKNNENSFSTHNGTAYARIGSTNKRIEGQALLDFLRGKQILSFDENVELSAKIEDIDENKVKEYLSQRNQKDYLKDHTVETFLLNSKLATKNGVLKIKNPAILLFSKEPVRFIPQSEIKLVFFSGVEPVNIISHKLVQETLFDSIKQSMGFIEKTLSKKIELRGQAKRIEEYEYPLTVIRESIVNAITHRDYHSKDAVQISIFDNRIEITSPGGLPNNLPKEMFGTLSVQRNPVTYRFLRDMGYVEGLGTGIPRMKKEMRDAGLPDPEFIITDSFIRVILYNRMKTVSYEEINLRQKKALEYLKQKEHMKAKDYAMINKVSHATAVNEINKLESYGLVRKVGTYRGAYYELKE